MSSLPRVGAFALSAAIGVLIAILLAQYPVELPGPLAVSTVFVGSNGEKQVCEQDDRFQSSFGSPPVIERSDRLAQTLQLAPMPALPAPYDSVNDPAPQLLTRDQASGFQESIAQTAHCLRRDSDFCAAEASVPTSNESPFAVQCEAIPVEISCEVPATIEPPLVDTGSDPFAYVTALPMEPALETSSDECECRVQPRQNIVLHSDDNQLIATIAMRPGHHTGLPPDMSRVDLLGLSNPSLLSKSLTTPTTELDEATSADTVDPPNQIAIDSEPESQTITTLEESVHLRRIPNITEFVPSTPAAETDVGTSFIAPVAFLANTGLPDPSSVVQRISTTVSCQDPASKPSNSSAFLPPPLPELASSELHETYEPPMRAANAKLTEHPTTSPEEPQSDVGPQTRVASTAGPKLENQRWPQNQRRRPSPLAQSPLAQSPITQSPIAQPTQTNGRRPIQPSRPVGNESEILSTAKELISNGRVEPAIELLSDGHRAFTNSVPILRALGAAYIHQRMYGQAAKCLQASLELNPRDAESHHLLGWAWRKSGRIQRSREHFRIAHSIDPNFAALP